MLQDSSLLDLLCKTINSQGKEGRTEERERKVSFTVKPLELNSKKVNLETPILFMALFGCC